MLITSAYDFPSVQTLREGEASQTSARRGKNMTVIAEVKFCISSTSLVSAVNLAARTFREEKTTTSTTTTTNFNVYINRERARARNK